MGRRLTVISYLRNMDPLFEEIAFKVQAQSSNTFIRCQWGSQLHALVMGSGRNLERLDLVGHGSPSSFWLGDGDDKPFLELGREPPPVLQMLAKDLPAGTEVRLLGCFTAVGEEGRALLQSTSSALGGKVVHGTTTRVEPKDFGPTGLRDDFRALHSTQMEGIASPTTGLQPASDLSPNPHLAHLLAVDQSDQEAALMWKTYFPAGYQPLGRGRPLARSNFTLQFNGARVTFACDCRLILIEDTPDKPPLLMGWSKPEPVPLLSHLMLPMTNGVPGNSLLVPPGNPAAQPRRRARPKRAANR